MDNNMITFYDFLSIVFNMSKILVEKPERKRTLRRFRCRWVDTI
jgi:hypothetical protein